MTTLHFETLKEDKENFKKQGFSKDNKFNQPQIVIGLIVNQDGFPVSYDIYAGNTFEGHTLIPSLTAFKKKHNVLNLTVIADAAMISLTNVEALIRNNIHYIVGARVSNLADGLIKEISKKLNMIDGASYRLIKARKYEGKADKLPRKIKFLKNLTKTKTVINEVLLEKTKLLLGIKGYYTDLDKETNETIIKEYHNLWHVEKLFRMAKTNLQTRPIYHYKNKAIHFHILICFMALAPGTYMELSTKRSLQKIIKLIKEAVEMKIKDKITGDIITIQPELSTELQELLKKLRFTY